MKAKLPIFPKFEKLSLVHKDALQAIANKFPSSDFNFAGLLTWDVGGVVEVSILNENLVIRSADYLTRDIFYSFIGECKIDETIKTLLDHAEKNGELTALKLVPESVAKNINSSLYRISEDRDNHDYIYNVKNLFGLQGSKYRSMRRRISRFSRLYGANITVKDLDLADIMEINNIEKVMSEWQRSRNKNTEDVRDEFVAIKKALAHQKVLDLKALGVFDHNKLIAFQIYEILPINMAIGHFEKADTSYTEVFAYLKHVLANHLLKMNIEFYNTEQDLGLPGLRESKEMHQPSHFIKKYTVERIKED